MTPRPTAAMLLSVALSAGLAAADEPTPRIIAAITNAEGRPLESATVTLCGLEKKLPDGSWDRNRRPHCLMPRVAVKKAEFSLPFAANAFEQPVDTQSIRANFWIEHEGYAPTFIAGLAPSPNVRTVVLQRGLQAVGHVRRQMGAKLVPLEGAAVELRCVAGDLEYQRRYFRDPLSTAMDDGGDLGFRRTVVTGPNGGYVLQLAPAPAGKTWYVVCLDEAVAVEVRDGEPIALPDFVVTVQARTTGNVDPNINGGAAAP